MEVRLTHACTGAGCSHGDHDHASGIGFRPVRTPAPIPAQALPESAALAIQAVRARLAIADGRTLPPASPTMFLRLVPDLGEGPRALSIEHVDVVFSPDAPRSRSALTALLRGATGLDLRPTRVGPAWRWTIGIEAILDPAVALTIWQVAAGADGVASASVTGYSADGLWTIEDGLEEGSHRILRAGPVGEAA